MNYLKQFGIILGVSTLGEILRFIIPLAIPSTVYGLVLMLTFLILKIIKVSQVKEVSAYLLEIMPILFVPSAVGLMTTWGQLKSIAIPVCIIASVTTVLVIIITGKISDLIMLKGGKKHE